MTLTGTVIGGVASLISTAVSADLGRHPELSNSKEALSTVTGIIDGTGSAGAAIGQVKHKISYASIRFIVIFCNVGPWIINYVFQLIKSKKIFFANI